MSGVEKKFKLFSGKRCLMVAMVCAVVITIPAAVHSACVAECDETSTFNIGLEIVIGQPTTTHYELITPPAAQFFACMRVWITEAGVNVLADTSEFAVWEYRESPDATEICLHNSGIRGTSLAGEDLEGPFRTLICYSDCLYEEEEEEE